MEKVKAQVFISGKVQGVFFRANTKNQADRLRLCGWVKNLDDGRVEAAFEGPREQVEEMVKWCRRGSEGAKVEEVKANWGEPEGLEEFEIRR